MLTGPLSGKCEATHTRSLRSAIIKRHAGRGDKEDLMTTRRLAYWWLRFVFSGRFLDTFLGRRSRRP
ncbi:hypothetical protein BRAS3843_1460022 [Bradyrhizobium sp. STM 3843]|nr:hypothetical protein BRAS3843_1460022 [Bradyrhizobium sp. STM 3843]